MWQVDGTQYGSITGPLMACPSLAPCASVRVNTILESQAEMRGTHWLLYYLVRLPQTCSSSIIGRTVVAEHNHYALTFTQYDEVLSERVP